MSKTLRDIIIIIGLFLVGAVVGAVVGRLTLRPVPPEIITIKEKSDTTYIHDTTYIDRPVPVYSKVIDTAFVPVYVEGKTDTIYAEIPIEQKVYEHQDFKAWVSGYRPALDSLKIYNNTAYIETTRTVMVEQSPWALSVQAGYGIGPSGLTPNISIGISYRIWSPKKKTKVTPPP